MELIVRRHASDDACTLGELLVDGEHECWTLEDPIREQPGVPVSQWKIPGQTAIPAGAYNVTITYSPHFGRNMPLVNDVPGFSGVRIHTGNAASDTDGCLLVGETLGVDAIRNSVAAFSPLYDKIANALAAGEVVTIEYINP
jgi:hypothetical protein